MGDLWIQVLARDDRDLPVLNRAFDRSMSAQDVIGYETLIAADPGNAVLHDDAAVLYLKLDQPANAVRHFEASLQLDPTQASRHFKLAAALMVQGRTDEAVRQYGETLRIDSDF